jgi:hypothetical protein
MPKKVKAKSEVKKTSQDDINIKTLDLIDVISERVTATGERIDIMSQRIDIISDKLDKVYQRVGMI